MRTIGKWIVKNFQVNLGSLMNYVQGLLTKIKPLLRMLADQQRTAGRRRTEESWRTRRCQRL